MNFVKIGERFALRTKKLLAVSMAALLLLTALAFQGILPVSLESREAAHQKAAKSVNELAWWGSLYPRTCLKGAMHLVEAPSETPEKAAEEEASAEESEEAEEAPEETSQDPEHLPVKIKWKCKDLFS